MNEISIDCEFNGFNGCLISMALVADNGEEFYEVVEMDEVPVEWVKANVMPILYKEPIPLSVFKDKLASFLSQFKKGVHIFADWPDDIKYLCEAVITAPGERMWLPNPFIMSSNETLNSTSHVPHNALWDARANMEEWTTMKFDNEQKEDETEKNHND